MASQNCTTAIESVYKYLEQEVAGKPYLAHAKNILQKKRDKNTSNLDDIAAEYAKYLKANDIHGAEHDIVAQRVTALNQYYNFIHTKQYDNIYSPQSKFRPTILEEFIALLFRDLVNGFNLPLHFGQTKAYANLYFVGEKLETFAKSPSIKLNTKDQDFAIYRDIAIGVGDGGPVKANLPIVAAECKTYVDKTMFENAVATAEKIKLGNPYSFFCIVTESYDISKDVDPAYTRIDQIYVLRKNQRKSQWRDIDGDVVLSLVNDVKHHLERPWADVLKKLSDTGRLI